jgi:hypothetical protein
MNIPIVVLRNYEGHANVGNDLDAALDRRHGLNVRGILVLNIYSLDGHQFAG